MCGCLIRANCLRIGEIDGMYGQIIDMLRFYYKVCKKEHSTRAV